VKLTQEQQYMVLGLIVFILVGIGYYQFGLKPVWQHASELQATLTAKEKDLKDAKEIVAKYPEFKKRSASIQRELEWFQNRIPATLDRAKMLESISALQAHSGVQLVSFASQAVPVKKDKYTEVPVDIHFKSSFADLLVFIHEMGYAETLMTVGGVRFTYTPNGALDGLSIDGLMTVKGAMANAGEGTK